MSKNPTALLFHAWSQIGFLVWSILVERNWGAIQGVFRGYYYVLRNLFTNQHLDF